MKPKMILSLAAGSVVMIVLLQNTQVVTLKLLFWEISMSRIILLPLILLCGVGLGFFLGRKY